MVTKTSKAVATKKASTNEPPKGYQNGAVSIPMREGTDGAAPSLTISASRSLITAATLPFSRGITSEKVELCTELRRTSCLRTDAGALVYAPSDDVRTTAQL